MPAPSSLRQQLETAAPETTPPVEPASVQAAPTTPKRPKTRATTPAAAPQLAPLPPGPWHPPDRPQTVLEEGASHNTGTLKPTTRLVPEVKDDPNTPGNEAVLNPIATAIGLPSLPPNGFHVEKVDHRMERAAAEQEQAQELDAQVNRVPNAEKAAARLRTIEAQEAKETEDAKDHPVEDAAKQVMVSHVRNLASVVGGAVETPRDVEKDVALSDKFLGSLNTVDYESLKRLADTTAAGSDPTDQKTRKLMTDLVAYRIKQTGGDNYQIPVEDRDAIVSEAKKWARDAVLSLRTKGIWHYSTKEEDLQPDHEPTLGDVGRALLPQSEVSPSGRSVRTESAPMALLSDLQVPEYLAVEWTRAQAENRKPNYTHAISARQDALTYELSKPETLRDLNSDDPQVRRTAIANIALAGGVTLLSPDVSEAIFATIKLPVVAYKALKYAPRVAEMLRAGTKPAEVLETLGREIDVAKDLAARGAQEEKLAKNFKDPKAWREALQADETAHTVYRNPEEETLAQLHAPPAELAKDRFAARTPAMSRLLLDRAARSLHDVPEVASLFRASGNETNPIVNIGEDAEKLRPSLETERSKVERTLQDLESQLTVAKSKRQAILDDFARRAQKGEQLEEGAASFATRDLDAEIRRLGELRAEAEAHHTDVTTALERGIDAYNENLDHARRLAYDSVRAQAKGVVPERLRNPLGGITATPSPSPTVSPATKQAAFGNAAVKGGVAAKVAGAEDLSKALAATSDKAVVEHIAAQVYDRIKDREDIRPLLVKLRENGVTKPLDTIRALLRSSLKAKANKVGQLQARLDGKLAAVEEAESALGKLRSGLGTVTPEAAKGIEDLEAEVAKARAELKATRGVERRAASVPDVTEDTVAKLPTIEEAPPVEPTLPTLRPEDALKETTSAVMRSPNVTDEGKEALAQVSGVLEALDPIREGQRAKRYGDEIGEMAFWMVGEPYTREDWVPTGISAADLPVSLKDHLFRLAREREHAALTKYWMAVDPRARARLATGSVTLQEMSKADEAARTFAKLHGLPSPTDRVPLAAFWKGPADYFYRGTEAKARKLEELGVPRAKRMNPWLRSLLAKSDPLPNPPNPRAIRFGDTVLVRDPEAARAAGPRIHPIREGGRLLFVEGVQDSFVGRVVGINDGRLEVEPLEFIGATPRRRTRGPLVRTAPENTRYLERGRTYYEAVGAGGGKKPMFPRLLTEREWGDIRAREDAASYKRDLQYGPDSQFVDLAPPKRPQPGDFEYLNDELSSAPAELRAQIKGAVPRGVPIPQLEGGEPVGKVPPKPLAPPPEPFPAPVNPQPPVDILEKTESLRSSEGLRKRLEAAQAQLAAARKALPKDESKLTDAQRYRLGQAEKRVQELRAEAEGAKEDVGRARDIFSSAGFVENALREAHAQVANDIHKPVALALTEEEARTAENIRRAMGDIDERQRLRPPTPAEVRLRSALFQAADRVGHGPITRVQNSVVDALARSVSKYNPTAFETPDVFHAAQTVGPGKDYIAGDVVRGVGGELEPDVLAEKQLTKNFDALLGGSDLLPPEPPGPPREGPEDEDSFEYIRRISRIVQEALDKKFKPLKDAMVFEKYPKERDALKEAVDSLYTALYGVYLNRAQAKFPWNSPLNPRRFDNSYWAELATVNKTLERSRRAALEDSLTHLEKLAPWDEYEERHGAHKAALWREFLQAESSKWWNGKGDVLFSRTRPTETLTRDGTMFYRTKPWAQEKATLIQRNRRVLAVPIETDTSVTHYGKDDLEVLRAAKHGTGAKSQELSPKGSGQKKNYLNRVQFYLAGNTPEPVVSSGATPYTFNLRAKLYDLDEDPNKVKQAAQVAVSRAKNRGVLDLTPTNEADRIISELGYDGHIQNTGWEGKQRVVTLLNRDVSIPGARSTSVLAVSPRPKGAASMAAEDINRAIEEGNPLREQLHADMDRVLAEHPTTKVRSFNDAGGLYQGQGEHSAAIVVQDDLPEIRAVAAHAALQLHQNEVGILRLPLEGERPNVLVAEVRFPAKLSVGQVVEHLKSMGLEGASVLRQQRDETLVVSWLDNTPEGRQKAESIQATAAQLSDDLKQQNLIRRWQNVTVGAPWEATYEPITASRAEQVLRDTRAGRPEGEVENYIATLKQRGEQHAQEYNRAYNALDSGESVPRVRHSDIASGRDNLGEQLALHERHGTGIAVRPNEPEQTRLFPRLPQVDDEAQQKVTIAKARTWVFDQMAKQLEAGVPLEEVRAWGEEIGKQAESAEDSAWSTGAASASKDAKSLLQNEATAKKMVVLAWTNDAAKVDEARGLDRRRYWQGLGQMRLGQKVGDEVKGYIDFARDGSADIAIRPGADTGTYFHELAHFVRRALAPEDMTALERAYGIQNGVWSEADEERFAEEFVGVLKSRPDAIKNPALLAALEEAAPALRDAEARIPSTATTDIATKYLSETPASAARVEPGRGDTDTLLEELDLRRKVDIARQRGDTSARLLRAIQVSADTLSMNRDTLDRSLRPVLRKVLRDYQGERVRLDEKLFAAVERRPKTGANTEALALLAENGGELTRGWEDALDGGTVAPELLDMAATAYIDQTKLPGGLSLADRELLRDVIRNRTKGDMNGLAQALYDKSAEVLNKSDALGLRERPLGDVAFTKAAGLGGLQADLLKKSGNYGAVLGTENAQKVAEAFAGTVRSDEGMTLLLNALTDPNNYVGDFAEWWGDISRGVRPDRAPPFVPAKVTSAGRSPKTGADIIRTLKLVEDSQVYIPRAMRRAMLADVDEALLVGRKAIGSRMLARLWKQMLTTGIGLANPVFYLNNFIGDFTQMASVARIDVAYRQTARNALQNLLALPGVANITRLGDVFRGTRAGTTLRDTSDVIGKISDFLTFSHLNRETGLVMDAADGTVDLGGRSWVARDLYRIAARAGVPETFETTHLAKALSDALAPQSKLMHALSENNRAIRDMSNLISTRQRFGMFLTLVDSGVEPERAAKLTVDALYDYRHSLHDVERGIVQLFHPFWAFEKNNTIRTVKAFLNPGPWMDGWMTPLYRVKIAGNSVKESAQLLTAALDPRDEYGFDTSSMQPEERTEYEAFRDHWRKEGFTKEQVAKLLDSNDYREGTDLASLKLRYWFTDPVRAMLPDWARNRWATFVPFDRSTNTLNWLRRLSGTEEGIADDWRAVPMPEDANAAGLTIPLSLIGLVANAGKYVMDNDPGAKYRMSDMALQTVADPTRHPLVAVIQSMLGAPTGYRDRTLPPGLGEILHRYLGSNVSEVETVPVTGAAVDKSPDLAEEYAMPSSTAAWADVLPGIAPLLAGSLALEKTARNAQGSTQFGQDPMEARLAQLGLMGIRAYPVSAEKQGAAMDRATARRIDDTEKDISAPTTRLLPESSEQMNLDATQHAKDRLDQLFQEKGAEGLKAEMGALYDRIAASQAGRESPGDIAELRAVLLMRGLKAPVVAKLSDRDVVNLVPAIKRPRRFEP